MSAIAGRVLLIPRGTYDSTYTYSAYDLVYYQGSTYVCKKTALNVLPSNTEYWQIMAQGTASASVAGNYYAECDTSASTPAKVITVPATEYFVLQVGDIVNVKFTYTNTAINPTLNINNTGNKPIVYDTSAVTTDNLWAGGEAGRITSFMYDGTNWVWISHDVDTNTLSDLLDTAISSPTNKQGLIFNGISNKWENADIEGLPSNVITYAQFIQMSDAEQLAFTGNVTDYPGIDDEPVADDVIYDNTDSGLTANNVQDAIDEVESRISAYTLGTAMDLISYTSSSNPYIFQSDGYLYLRASTTSGSYIIAKINDTFSVISRYNSCDYCALFVRKGMSVFIAAKSTGTLEAKFYPLS